jgi:hypothetical protein
MVGSYLVSSDKDQGKEVVVKQGCGCAGRADPDPPGGLIGLRS